MRVTVHNHFGNARRARDAEPMMYRGHVITQGPEGFVARGTGSDSFVKITAKTLAELKTKVDKDLDVIYKTSNRGGYILDRKTADCGSDCDCDSCSKHRDTLPLKFRDSLRTGDVSISTGQSRKQLATRLRQSAEADRRGSGMRPLPGRARGEPNEASFRSAARQEAMADWLDTQPPGPVTQSDVDHLLSMRG